MQNIQIMDLNGYQLGSHLSFHVSISHTVNFAISQGLYSVQFFLGSPKSYKRRVVTSEDIKQTKNLINRFPTNIYSHFPYISNLAGSKNILAWDGDKQQDWKTTQVLKGLEYELEVLSNFKNNGVVIHPGCHKNRVLGLKNISKTINKIDFTPNSTLLLENCAGEGSKLATTFDELKLIIDGVEKNKKEHIGVCIDTQHLFAYGEYDIRQKEEIDRMFTDFDKKIGLKRFKLLHLNDSCVEKGKKVDRHANIGEGYIWGESTDSLLFLLDKCRDNNIPMVTETERIDVFYIQTLV